MAQNHMTVVDTNGTVLLDLTADTDMRGVAINAYQTWHSVAMLDRYIAEIGTLMQWLKDQGAE